MGALAVSVSPAAASSDNSVSPSQLVSSSAPQLGFGGYISTGHVTQIAASWRVPEIRRGSKSGSAATWVGAQDNGGDFIQIGTTEDLDLDGQLEYQAFWSDAVLHFVPQDLGTVQPGDSISVSMKQKGFGWTIRATDAKRSLRVIRPIEYGFGDRFTFAEWIQENPSSYTSGLPTIPYPSIGVPTFTQLELDGGRPTLPLSDALTLITSSGHFRVPTETSGDSFTFRTPSAAQYRFLSAMSGPNATAVSFGSALSQWSQLSRVQRGRAISQFGQSLSASATSMAAFTWPGGARSPILRLVAECRLEDRDLTAWSSGGGHESGSAYGAWLNAEIQRQSLTNRSSAVLDLPPAA